MTSGPPAPDHRGDGDGWVTCAQGHRHWGLFGAAGLLLHRDTSEGGTEVLLQHRAEWSHHGGTWGLLGGARASGESEIEAALREAGEEGGVPATAVDVHGRFDEPHGGWAYTTVLACTDGEVVARPTGGESIDVTWFAVDEVAGQPLHPALARTWPLLRRALAPLTLVVDAANVVGSRPDGWWRDRTGAADRLASACARLARAGLAGDDLPGSLDLPPLTRRWPRVVLVVEGAARDLDPPPVRHLVVRRAARSGDDAVVDEVARSTGPVLAVTADRGLRRRVASAGGVEVGPRWLTDQLDRLDPGQSTS